MDAEQGRSGVLDSSVKKAVHEADSLILGDTSTSESAKKGKDMVLKAVADKLVNRSGGKRKTRKTRRS